MDITIIDPKHGRVLDMTGRGTKAYWEKYRQENMIRNKHWAKQVNTKTIFSTRTLNPKWFEIQNFLDGRNISADGSNR